MSSSIRQRKLEQQRERQLSRQQQRRQNLGNNNLNSSVQTENVEYINAYDNPAHSIGEDSPKTRKPKNKSSSKSKSSKNKEVTQLIDLLDDEEDFTIPANVYKPSKIENENTEENDQDNDSTPTPYDQNKHNMQDGDLFNLSDASSESNFSMRDDVSMAGGVGVVGIRPGTAQNDYEPKKLQGNASTSSFDRIPIAAKTAQSFLNKISTHRPNKTSSTNIHPMNKSRSNSLERTQRKIKKKIFENNSQNLGKKSSSPREHHTDNIPTLCSLFSKMPTQESPFAFIPGMGHVKSTEEFAFSPASWEHKDGTAIRSRITRDKRGSKFGPGVRYYMHLEMPGGGSSRQFVLSARKRTRAKTSNYLISTDVENINRDSTNIIGKLRSNALGTRFVSFDNGVAANATEALKNSAKIRREMCMVLYETNILGFHGPRRMTCVIPGMQESDVGEKERVECRPMVDSDSMSSRFDKGRMDDFIVLENKKPVWNQDTQSFVLNFHGRVTMASVKNFQIIHKDNPNYIIMQFGRISEDVFTIDYRYPLSAYQAFSIALSSFDSKLACE